MKNAVKCTAMTTLLLALFTSHVFAWEVRPERPIPGTPFDKRLANVGFFDVALAAAPASEAQSVEALFMTAKSFRYVPDTRGDKWQTVDETDRKHSGDCEDKAFWLYTKLKESGHDARIVIGKYRKLEKNLHVWVSCTNDKGENLVLDPSIQKRVWSASGFAPEFYRPLYSFDGKAKYSHA